MRLIINPSGELAVFFEGPFCAGDCEHESCERVFSDRMAWIQYFGWESSITVIS